MQHDDGLSSTLKELQLLEQQLAKDQRKVEGASAKKAGSAQAKVVETQRSLEQTTQIWETEAPFAFESYQKMDTQRLNLMKEVVTRFETMQSDAAQRLMSITENTLQSVLNFDPESEMQEFMLRNGKAGAVGSGASARGPASQPPDAAAGAAAAPPARPSVNTPTRRGTMLQRNGSTASSLRPNTAPRSATNGSNAEFGAGTSSASTRSSFDQQRTATSRAGGATSTLKSALGRFGRNKSKQTGGDDAANTTYGSLADGPPRMSTEGRGSGRANGNASDDEDDAPLSDVLASRREGAGLMQPMVPTRASAPPPASPAPAAATSEEPRASAPQVDSEGFSIPPPDRKPWDEPSTSAMGDESREEMADTASPLGSTQRGMGNMNISSGPVGINDSTQDKAALERVRSTLLGSAPARRNTTRRDRRDVRNTVYNPMASVGGTNGGNGGAGAALGGEAAATSQVGGLSPQPTGGSTSFAAPMSPTFTGGGVGAGAASMQSGAMGGSGTNPFEAATGTPGLRAYINETVNAILTPSGVARVMIVGEVSISGKDLPSSGPLHLRVEAFEQLEKAAPNPGFLTAVPSQPGEYQLDVAALQRVADTLPQGATILKYQLHVSPSRLAEYVPLNVDARWRLEPHQTSFLLNYSRNDSVRLSEASSGSGAWSLQDLAVVTPVGPTPVTSVMSKPEGNWDADAKQLSWTLSESDLAAGAGSGKLLARFQVDGQGNPQPVQIRWRLPGQTMSSLGLSVAGASGIAFDEVVRQTVSGKYVAQ